MSEHGPVPHARVHRLLALSVAGGVSFAGVVFPDLLRARWALFFHALDMPWQFQPLSFTLGSGAAYVPDFWLPVQRTWFHVAVDCDGYWSDDLELWRDFALAADSTGYAEHLRAETGSLSDIELADLDDDLLDQAICARTCLPLPSDWQGSAVYSAGGIPDPRTMEDYGPATNAYGSMLVIWDNWYQWTRCPTCGYVGAEFNGRADRLACGHGDQYRDKNYRSNDPRLLQAYGLARRAIAARYGSGCARCDDPIEQRALVLRGPRVGGRAWYHAGCRQPWVSDLLSATTAGMAVGLEQDRGDVPSEPMPAQRTEIVAAEVGTGVAPRK